MAAWQLAACGVDRGRVARRIARGQLVKVAFGVYAAGHRGWGKDARRLATVLGVGPEAKLAARSACANWGLIADERATVDVVTTRRGRANRRGVTLRRIKSLAPDEVTVHDGKPTTSVAVSILHANAEPADIEEMLEQALTLQLFDQRAFDDVVARHAGQRGAARLAEVLGRVEDDPDELRSALERRFRALVRRYDLPSPSYNHRHDRSIFDAFYPQLNLAIELDSRRWNDRKRAFEADKRRDRRNRVDHGIETLRLTSKDLAHDADQVAADIAALTARARSTAAARRRPSPRGS